tara:strand:+ start:261 stop:680 length:420 start_codon:yes stop_codon:yes gene_type:complete
MLSTLIKAFVGANIISAGTSKALGVEDPLANMMGSFLGVGRSSGSSGGGGGFEMIDKMTNPNKFKTSISKGPLSAPKMQSSSPSQAFPVGTNNSIRRGMADYRIAKLLQDVSLSPLGNKTIKLDDYDDYKTTETKIDVT